MSLLLEALKKAELAKQGSLGTSQQTEEPSSGGISFEEMSPPTLDTDSLPDLNPTEPVRREPQNFETPRESVPPPRQRSVAPPPEEDISTPSPPPPQREPDRVAARQLFEAKEVDYNPKRPFYITLGLLVLAGVGYGGYVWWELQPRTAVNLAAVKNAPKAAPIAKAPPSAVPQPQDAAPPEADGTAKPASTDPSAPTAPPAAAQNQAQVAQAQAPAKGVTAPASPVTQSAQVQTPAVTAKPVPQAAATGPTAAPSRQPSKPAVTAPQPPSALPATPPPPPARAEAARAPRLPIKITPPSFQANEVLESAYTAFQQGELDRARSQYQQVLAREGANRDALLGLAAIDVRTRDFETAELRYLRLLELDPRDAHAHAALIALQGNVDPVQSESRIKNLIASQPDATHLYFTLGNQYASQTRWAEAQDAYFKAFTSDPANADYAFNLAVSLDQLRQPKLAVEYYKKAVFLAGTRLVGFDRRRAETRVRELDR